MALHLNISVFIRYLWLIKMCSMSDPVSRILTITTFFSLCGLYLQRGAHRHGELRCLRFGVFQYTSTACNVLILCYFYSLVSYTNILYGRLTLTRSCCDVRILDRIQTTTSRLQYCTKVWLVICVIGRSFNDPAKDIKNLKKENRFDFRWSMVRNSTSSSNTNGNPQWHFNNFRLRFMLCSWQRNWCWKVLIPPAGYISRYFRTDEMCK